MMAIYEFMTQRIIRVSAAALSYGQLNYGMGRRDMIRASRQLRIGVFQAQICHFHH